MRKNERKHTEKNLKKPEKLRKRTCKIAENRPNWKYWQETAEKVRSRTETFKNGPGVRKQLQLAESGRNRMRTDASARKQT